MKHLVLAFCLLTISSLQAINNNVELIANGGFSTNVTPAASVAFDATAGVWFAGNNGLATWNTVPGFIADAATGAYVTSNGTASVNIYDNFLSQITSDATINTGRYHFSISASGNQSFYVKISSAASATVLGTELTYSLKNASSLAIEKQTSPDYAGYSLKITPTGTTATYSADLDLQNATPSSLRIFIVFPKVGNVTVDDISFMRTADVPTYTTFYVRPATDNTSWTSLIGIDPDQIITSNAPSIVGTNTYYYAKGTYTQSLIAITTGKLYGGFKGDETTIDLSARALSDKDANGIIEQWEFTNEAIITGTNPISGTVSSNRLITVTGGEINGLTLQDQFYNAAGTIILGSVSSSPTAGMDILANAGKMINCTVKKIKSSSSAPIMTTNQYSLIDGCLIEECSSTSASSGATGAVFMNALGGKIANSVLRNNSAVGGTSAYAGAIRASALSSTDMNAIVQNCAIYNNTSGGGGGAIRCDAQSNKRGIQIINCTIVNNKSTSTSTSSVDLIAGGLIVNSIVVDDPKDEIRPNNNNNYIASNAYGSILLGSIIAYPNTNMVSGKTATNFNFNSYSPYVGSMQPGDAGFVQATYDAIRASNYSITSTSSVACTATPLATIPSSYLIGGTGASVALTASVPATDLTGLTRTGTKTLGAYQATHSVASGVTETISQPTTLASLTVAAGGKLTINSGVTASIGSLTLESDAAGTATMLNSGTFTGTVIAKQYLGSARNWYVSSPVSNATSPANNVDYYYEYVEAGNNNDFASQSGTSSLYWKGLANGTTMEVGKGYIAKSNAGTTVQFSGTPNNGNITTVFDLTRNDAKGKGFNLVGNPYPSYIDWSLVAAANTNLSNTFYFRSKNTNVTSTYTFVTYNGLLNTSVSSNGTANTTTTRFIPPTQAFWVRVNSGTGTTKMYFNNNMRAHRDDNGNLLKSPKAENSTRLRLQLINGSEADETLICTDANAENGFDRYDSPKMMNNSSVTPDLYSKADAERLVINGLNAITDNLEFPLGFSLNATASLKLKATEMSNFPVGTRIFLLDKDESTQVELLPETEYNFNTTAPNTNNESRFSLLFRVPGVTTDIENATKLNAQVFVNAANQITIVAPEKSNYTIYNAMGQLIAEGAINHLAFTINHSKGVYVVKVNNQSTRVIVK